MDLIKLTDSNGMTYGQTQWQKGEERHVEWSGKFCAPGCIHVYKDLHAGLLLNPIHASFMHPRAWKATGYILRSDRGLKFGVASLRIESEIYPLPVITPLQRLAFGIYVAKEIKYPPLPLEWWQWTDDWLIGEDRTVETALVAYNAVQQRVIAFDSLLADHSPTHRTALRLATCVARLAARPFSVCLASRGNDYINLLTLIDSFVAARAEPGELDFTELARKSMETKAIPEPTYSVKPYHCARCGHVQQIDTNHWSETYNSRCPECSWKNPSQPFVTWVCDEPCPVGYGGHGIRKPDLRLLA